MATEQDDSSIPDSGAVFTFGKSRFADNFPSKFWVRDDAVLHAACGDEHTVLITESGRVFTFGDNAYGQLGLGNDKAQTKPTCVKSLKGEKVRSVGCGKSHTLLGTESGQLFAFGANADRQSGGGGGDSAEDSCTLPVAVTLPRGVGRIRSLDGGTAHSLMLTEDGKVYGWGSNSEGQLGLGEDVDLIGQPTLIKFEKKISHIACGYYHSAAISDDGRLYAFGESDGGKLGLGDSPESTSKPQHVVLPEKAVGVACGGNHTAVVVSSGKLYTFGSGQQGQLGQGTALMESAFPGLVSSLKDVKVKSVSCGDGHTTAITSTGQLYTFGDGRHGRLALGAENLTNQFRPFRVARFQKFAVASAHCGGCHTIVIARRSVVGTAEEGPDDEDTFDPLNSTFANSLRISTDGELGGTARDRRRQKPEASPLLNRPLPPLRSGVGTATLPPLNSKLLPSPLLSSREAGSLVPSKGGGMIKRQSNGSGSDDQEDNDNSSVSVTPIDSNDEYGDEKKKPNALSREAVKKQSDAVKEKALKEEAAKSKADRTKEDLLRGLKDDQKNNSTSSLKKSLPTKTEKPTSPITKSRNRKVDNGSEEEEDDDESEGDSGHEESEASDSEAVPKVKPVTGKDKLLKGKYAKENAEEEKEILKKADPKKADKETKDTKAASKDSKNAKSMTAKAEKNQKELPVSAKKVGKKDEKYGNKGKEVKKSKKDEDDEDDDDDLNDKNEDDDDDVKDEESEEEEDDEEAGEKEVTKGKPKDKKANEKKINDKKGKAAGKSMFNIFSKKPPVSEDEEADEDDEDTGATHRGGDTRGTKKKPPGKGDPKQKSRKDKGDGSDEEDDDVEHDYDKEDDEDDKKAKDGKKPGGVQKPSEQKTGAAGPQEKKSATCTLL